MNKQRPKHFDLHLVQLPLSGFVSMFHRMMVEHEHQVGRPHRLHAGAPRRDRAAGGQR